MVKLPSDALRPGEILAYTWGIPGGPVAGDIFAPHPWKTYDLLPPSLTQTITATPDGWQIGIAAEKLALFVAVEADQPGRFCDNAATIFPGYPATIIFIPTTQGAAPQFTLRDLHSATYGT